MRKLYILGAGDLAREILMTFHVIKNSMQELTDVEFQGFAVSNGSKVYNELEGYGVFELSELKKTTDQDTYFIIGIGNPISVNKIKNDLKSLINNINWINIIHPASVIAEDVSLGEGLYVAANTTISCGAKIKNNVIINQNVSVGHDVVIKESVVISPGCVISGRVKLDQKVFLGSAAVIYPGVIIGEECQIAANVVVSKNVKAKHKLMQVIKSVELPIN